MRLTLVIASLGRGGAERTASVLAGAWAERGFKVTMITLERDDVAAYPLHPAVVLRQLKLRSGKAKHILHGLVRNLKMVRALRSAIRDSDPHAVISFMDISNILALLAAGGLDTRLIVTEHVHPAYHYIGWPWQMLRRFLYRRADVLVCVSRPVLEWFQTNLRITGYVIPNPVALASSPPQLDKTRNQGGHLIVGMGRLIEQKGFDLLLESFSRVAARHPGWSLKVIGEGPLRSQLEALRQQLGLTEQVEFTGELADPFPTLRAADLFVFSSRFEGFGNALCEAMACGVPAISFDCPSGPSEIIRHGIDGVLVPPEDVMALASAMDELMCDAIKRETLARRAPDVLNRFGVDRVLSMWERVFGDIIDHNTSRTK
jgi:GalNAc-alpha-(1->4)-GalNAc-alpha-(1->3)-diNAcBac-PP-undecaprenol alpha-1,4-N-acetyl-D-galactosaminyltransferase